MTKSSEGTMTAKEKYLAVHPDARAVEITPRRWLIAHGDDPEHPGYAILGMPFVSEEAAWQNAAESLPPQTEQGQPKPHVFQPDTKYDCMVCAEPINALVHIPCERCSCGAWICQGCGSCSSDCGCAEPKIPCDCWFQDKQVCDICQGVGGVDAQPVESLPVEAKENPSNLCKCGHGHWNKQGGCSCCPCKEYKPVESLPVETNEKAAPHVFQPDTKYNCMVCDEPINALIHIPADEGSGNKALCPCTASGQCAGVSASLACRSDLKIAFAEPKPTLSTPATLLEPWKGHSCADTLLAESLKDPKWAATFEVARKKLDSEEVKEQLNEALRAKDEKNKVMHREIIDQGRKVLNATSEIGMSHSEFIEWALERLEGKL